MKQFIGTLLLIVWLPLLAAGQDADHKGQGYVYFAPGVTSPCSLGTMHIGGGGEGLVLKGLGLGADVGYLAPWRSFGEGVGTFSPNVFYHFQSRNREVKAEPFVTGGYTLFFRSGTANGLNFGGGVNYWFKEHIGLRFEVRENVMRACGDTGHFIGFRIGLTFR